MPIVNNSTYVAPVERPDTIAKSLAIGDPGDGRYVLKRLEQYGGVAVESVNAEILEGITLLARTEGIFTEPAGGVAVAALQKMVNRNEIDSDQTVVCYITGNGLKATETIMQVLKRPTAVKADIKEVSAVVN